jgi:hypothetical protein
MNFKKCNNFVFNKLLKNGVDKILADVHANKDNLFHVQYFYKIKKDRYKNYFIYVYNKDYYKTLNLPMCIFILYIRFN